MSTKENKIEVITDWLVRCARKQRLTNYVEVQVAAGLGLAEKGYRANGSCVPVEFDDVVEALNEIAETSFAQDGAILPALVVHFGDKKPGHRFVKYAGDTHLITLPEFNPDSVDNEEEMELDDFGVPRYEVTDEVQSLHADQVTKIFAHYAPVSV